MTEYKEIPLTQGKVTIVDSDDYEYLSQFKWYYAQGYAVRNTRNINGKRQQMRMHRVIAETPEEMVTDHINGDTLDNRKNNLRNVTYHENTFNAKKKTKAMSKYKGVSKFKGKTHSFYKYTAKLQHNKERILIGYFPTEKQAALAYNEKAKEYFGEFASLNEIEGLDMDEYHYSANRTLNDKDKHFTTKLANYCLGLTGESGEVADHIKKFLYHGHELEEEKIIEEIGDVLWYIAALCTTLRVDMSDVALRNIEKLETRYPNGFDEEKSKERVDVQ